MEIKIIRVTDNGLYQSLKGARTSIPDDVTEGYQFSHKNLNFKVQTIQKENNIIKLISPSVVLVAQIME